MNNYLASLGPALANHLWQSTAFGLLAWLLTLTLRRNHARVRYAVWLAASIKFLIPFSLLVSVGNLLPHPKQPVAPVVYSAMDVVEQPFAAENQQAVPALVHVPTTRERVESALPICLGTLWLLGFSTVLFAWCNRWRILSRSARQALVVTEGRELEILRRFDTGCVRPLPLLVSEERMEPGVLGVFGPVLVWPAQLSAQLDNRHIEAIVAHELMHVRRRDNLTALLHMLTEAVFWFHPLVWWIERQMVNEREQACDEAVVAMGGSAETYAESLLKTCWFCIESPLPCVSGVTGADLKRRVADIITGRTLLQMTWPKKLLLAIAALSAVTGPIVLGIAQEKAADPIARVFHPTPPLPSYDVATIKPAAPVTSPDGMVVIRGDTVREYIRTAFASGPNLAPSQVIGGPEWIDKDTYTITGKPPADLEAAMQKMNLADRAQKNHAMQQSLLADRFHLKVHFEVREMPIYALAPAKGGLKIKAEEAPAPRDPSGPPPPPLSPRGRLPTGAVMVGGTANSRTLRGHFIPMDRFITALSNLQGTGDRPILDETGFTGSFDFDLTWAPLTAAADSSSPSDAPSLGTALETLGLRLVATKGPVEVVVIDSIDRPSEN